MIMARIPIIALNYLLTTTHEYVYLGKLLQKIVWGLT